MSKRFPRMGWIIMVALLSLSLAILPACGGGGGGGGDTLLMRVASTDILVDPWNPVAGSNWIYDRLPQNGAQDMSVVPHPTNGLYIPWRLQKAEVVVTAGYPVGVTSPNDSWLTLTFNSTPAELAVDPTAYADWDASTKQWIAAGAGKYATTKMVAYFPTSIWDNTYHDGSKMSPADFMISAILAFDRAKPASAIYDQYYVAAFTAFMSHFKGVKFEFNTGGYGAIITTWDDTWYLDAEWIVGLNGNGYCWYPITPYGQMCFDNLALGILAEANSQLAFNNAKAVNITAPWMSFIGGPSLNILESYLNNVTNNASPIYQYIPYAPTMGTYITGAQALERYQKMKTWYNSHHHFWVGTGPYYVNTVNHPGKIVDLKKNTAYSLPGDKFFSVMNPVPTGPYPNVTGGWCDEIVMYKEAVGAAAITQLANNDMDVYAFSLADPALLATVEANANLQHYHSGGSFNDFTCNPAGNDSYPYFSNGLFNPLALKAIREALNKAVDRDYISSNIMGGLAVPRYTAVGTFTGDAVTFAAELANITSVYAYNFAVANTTIYNAMIAQPLITWTGGKYYYNGTLVNVRVLIRTEDERLQMGDYLADQVEDLGFDVTRQYGSSSVLSPIWRGSDPDLGTWNLYTGGWGSTGVSRDEGSNFGAFYTPLWAAMGILWAHYTPTPEFQAVCDALWYNSFTTIPERTALFQDGFAWSMQDSVRLFVVDRTAFTPLRKNAAVANDLAGGVYGCYLWATTIHFRDAGNVPIAPAS